jgi:hypothetical protein
VLVTWLERQAATTRGAQAPALAEAAREEQAFFEEEGRRLHRELLDRRPREVLGRALEAMARARSAA